MPFNNFQFSLPWCLSTIFDIQFSKAKVPFNNFQFSKAQVPLNNIQYSIFKGLGTLNNLQCSFSKAQVPLNNFQFPLQRCLSTISCDEIAHANFRADFTLNFNENYFLQKMSTFIFISVLKFFCRLTTLLPRNSLN